MAVVENTALSSPLQSLGSSLGSGVFAGDGRFNLVSKIGSGAFGQIYEAIDLVTNEALAVKLEKRGKTLTTEYQVYKELGNTPGFAKLAYKGEEGAFNVLALELLGPDLENLFSYCNGLFTHKTVMTLCDQILHALRALHDVGYLHRDIKPANFAMGTGEKANRVYLIDFGLSKKYITWNGDVIPFIEGKPFIGTVRYAPIAAHDGCEQSPGDDVESVCYMLGLFCSGRLPWQGIQAESLLERRIIVRDIKAKYLEGPDDLPRCVRTIYRYTRNLPYGQLPDYGYLLGLLSTEFKVRGYQKDFYFDWYDHVERHQQEAAMAST